MFRRTLVGVVVALGALCAGPAAALAHPLLLQTSPAAGLVDPAPPTQIELAFTEGAVAAGSLIEVTDSHGRRVPTGPVKASNGGEDLSVKLRTKVLGQVYSVRWAALGNDGHTTSGDFKFGVVGLHGVAPKGAEALTGQGGAGGRLESQAAAVEGGASIFARWVGLVAASLLIGGYALLFLLSRRSGLGTVPEQTAVGPDAVVGARALLERAAPLAWLILLLGVSGNVLADASSGLQKQYDLGLLADSPTGISTLVRAAIAVAISLGLLAAGRRPRLRAGLYLTGALAVTVTYALSGHTLTDSHGGALRVAEVEMVLHVLAATTWLGGILALVLFTAGGRVRPGAGALTFAPLAAGALAVAGVTGILSSVRNVGHWYFLRWSGYGQVIIVKTGLVLVFALIGGATALVARRGRSPRRGLLRLEAVGVIGVLALASVLAGVEQGQGQPLPAQAGDILAGPATATALTPAGSVRVVMAPARTGPNVISATIDSGSDDKAVTAGTVSVRMACACSPRSTTVQLSRTQTDGAWHADVSLDANGTWFGYVTVDGKAAPAPVSLVVGVPGAAGAPPIDVLSISDLSGPDADRCRQHLLGLELAIGRINATGGLKGGHKVTALVYDDANSSTQAASKTRAAISADHPVALVAPCGSAAAAAVQAAGAAGLPSIVGDPGVGPVTAARSFRTAADPYAEGYSIGQYLTGIVAPTAASSARTVRYLVAGDAQGARRLRGLQAALAGSKLQIVQVPETEFTGASKAQLVDMLNRASTVAMVLDGTDPAPLERALQSLGTGKPNFPPAPIVASSRVLSESFIQNGGGLGREGAILGATEVTPDSKDAQLFAGALPALYPGEFPTLDGLRGYVVGLALKQAVSGGTGAAGIASRLLRPKQFTDALELPWRADAPSVGSQREIIIAPQFLPPTLIPVQIGGEAFNGDFFPDGTWINVGNLYGPSLGKPVPPL
jgi:methionine-rich copper-binding protein CopC/putative copper export protein/ABC-type branched-subunit amino acid transport system substrate-binding protein